MVLSCLEKRLAGEFRPHSYWGDGILGRCPVIGDAGGLLGADHDAHCAAVNAWGAWEASKPRFIDTALGALLAGLLATYVESGMILYGEAIFALGLIGAVLRLDQSASRFAGITLTIVMLVTRRQAPWIIAVPRFVEVSLGITIALALTYLWLGPEMASAQNPQQNPSR